METLKRHLDWSARMNINRIGFELEDKFAYPSHPAIGAPGKFFQSCERCGRRASIRKAELSMDASSCRFWTIRKTTGWTHRRLELYDRARAEYRAGGVAAGIVQSHSYAAEHKVPVKGLAATRLEQ